MRHCGKERAGNFCSECGEPLAGSLELLLKHVKNHASTLEKKHDRREAFYRERNGGELSESQQSKLHRSQKSVDKWKGWANELEELLANTY